ncbi:MAG TPA: TonB family protein [Longimicrobium sp.]|nr:TonB family protein [Longimicrobium sp.]
MFKVLTGETKRRVISPATITASVAAHLLLVGGAVFAAGGETVETDTPQADTLVLWQADDPPPPPPPPVEQRPTPPAQAQPDEAVQTPPQGNQEEVEDVREAPEGIKTEEPGAEVVDLTRHTGLGSPGEIPGPPAGEVKPPAGSRDTGPRAYDMAVVEVRPVLESAGLTRLLERNYPSVLRDSRVNGRVIIELVVDEDGVPVPGSARVIEASHPAFGEATLRVADRFRFRPARIDGTPVPVVVTIPIVWTSR